LAVQLLEPLRPGRGRILAEPSRDLVADGRVRAPDEAGHDLVLGQRPAQLGSEGDLHACGDALAVDQYAVTVEYDEFDGPDHPRSTGPHP
jgi:hypothetical protein